MTGPASGGPERGTGASTRATGTQGAVGAILVVLALGLALRLIIAYLLPGLRLRGRSHLVPLLGGQPRARGPVGFYERDFFHDYTPGLPVRPVAGRAGRACAIGGVGDLIKVPPILADLAIGWLVWSMVRELGGRERLALGAALVAVLNPIAWFDSVVWGQVDSFGVVFLLLALRELWRDRPERAAIFTVIAAIIKPQLGILVPLVAVAHHPAGPVAGRRADTGRRHRPRPGRRRASSTACGPGRPRTGRWWRILTTGAGRLPDRGRPVPAVRAVRARAHGRAPRSCRPG